MNTTKIKHREENRIRVDFPYNQQIAQAIKQIGDARWSKTHRAWHIPDSEMAWTQLQTLFPEMAFNEIEVIDKPLSLETTIVQPILETTVEQPIVNQKSTKTVTYQDKNKIYVEVIGKKILVKMPKNDADVRFLLTLRYSRWEKAQFLWCVPNYPGNLEMIKNYFGNRLFDLKIHEEISTISSSAIPQTKLSKNEVLVYKTNTRRLKVVFGYVPELIKHLKSMPYCSYDTKNKWWTLPYSDKFLEEIKKKISDLNLELKYEEQANEGNKVPRISPYDIPNYRYCPEEYSLKLMELRYSPQTIKTYVGLFQEFINFYPTHDIKLIDEPMIIKFLRYLVIERKVSITYQNQSINAIKFYYEKVLGGQRKFYFIDRPAKEKTLPSVLSTEEVTEILKSTENIKHRAILMTIYSAGLRISEVINLKIKDIDSDRMQIRVEQGKGKVDRYTLLSEKTLLILRQYFKEYRPTVWLFEGLTKGEQYSTRSIQNVFQAAVKKANINKDVSVHTLRHSFATHLLENGTDLRYIQNLLGHANSKTTEIYTHITTKGFDQIKSPMDKLDF
jgi:integrase/recombinase XerD